MEQLNYFQLDDIIQLCVTGDIDMHEPIEITNKFKNQRVEISLLKHFLILCKQQQIPLIHILSRLRCQLREHLLQLIRDNAFIRHYTQNVIEEWRLDCPPEELFQDGLEQCNYSEGSDLFDYSLLTNEQKKSQEGGHRLLVIERGLESRQSENLPVTLEFADQIRGKIKDLHADCVGCVDRVKQHSSDLMSKFRMIDPEHLAVITDLASKSKPTYLEYSNQFKQDDNPIFASFLNDTHDLNIPENIHTIYLNYLITLNMIKKEINYMNHSFKHILKQMNPNLVVLTKFMDGFNELTRYDVTDSGELKEPPMDGEPLKEPIAILSDKNEPGLVDKIKSFSFF
tara:strand:+ start:158 stop:1180 length:1023 start_codon:yes stop_codon:yes gene_type:complete